MRSCKFIFIIFVMLFAAMCALVVNPIARERLSVDTKGGDLAFQQGGRTCAHMKTAPEISAKQIRAYGDEATRLDIGAPEISAKQAILINGETGEVIFEKNADEKAYPASVTKIMTALVTLETMKRWNADMDQRVKIPASAEGIAGSSIYLKAGEEVRIRDLLYGMMLRSGNDAAAALAEIIGGNTDSFLDMMNAKAIRLGCLRTHFANPSGLYNENHYTTARDMALISTEAMRDEDFRCIAAAREWQTEREPDTYNYFLNKNKVVFQYDGGNGVKIGYTEKSGRTLVASAERAGTLLICVVMDAPDWFDDATALLDYGFGSGFCKGDLQ